MTRTVLPQGGCFLVRQSDGSFRQYHLETQYAAWDPIRLSYAGPFYPSLVECLATLGEGPENSVCTRLQVVQVNFWIGE